MKYIKLFEESRDVYIYYKVFIEGSFDLFVIILDKLGIKQDLFNEWGIEDYYDLIEENREIFKNEFVYLVITEDKYGIPCKGEACGKSFTVESSLESLKEWIPDLSRYEYRGEIHVEEYEKDAMKYNL